MVIIIGLLVILYTALGGVRSVISTDVVQFVVFFGGLAYFGFAVIWRWGGVFTIWGNVANNIPPYGYFLGHPTFGARFLSAFFWSIFPIILISSAIVQRALLNSETTSVRRTFSFFSSLLLILKLFMLVVGLSAFMPGAFKNPETINVSILVEGICAHDLAKSAFLLAFLAMVMSTIGSILNALALMWAHDFIPHVWRGEKKSVDELSLARLVTACFGFIAIVCALVLPLKIFDLIEYAFVFFSVLSIPFLAGVLGLKGSDRGFKIAVGSFFLVFMVMRILEWQGWLPSFVTIAEKRRAFYFSNTISNRAIWFFAATVSGIGFLSHHYVNNGRYFIFAEKKKGAWHVTYRHPLKVSFHFLKEPLTWANKQVTKNGSYHALLSGMTVVVGPIPVIVGSSILEESVFFLLGSAFIVVLMMAAYLLASHLWDPRLRRYFDFYYLLSIWYILCLYGNFALLQTATTSLYMVMHMVVTLGVLAFLVDWQSFLFLEALGMAGALLVSWLWQHALPPCFNTAFIVAFSVVGLISMLLAHEKEQLKEDLWKHLDANISAESKEQFTTMYETVRQKLNFTGDNPNPGKKVDASTIPSEEEGHKEGTIEGGTTLLHTKGAADPIPLHIKKVTIRTLISKAQSHSKPAKGKKASKVVMVANNSTITHLSCDERLMVQALASGMGFIMAKEKKVTLQVEEGLLAYETPAGKERTLPAICFVFTSPKHAEKAPKKSQKLYKALVKEGKVPEALLQSQRIVHAHQGAFEKSADLLRYTIPQNVKDAFDT